MLWRNRLLYPEGNVIKYILRHQYKGGKQDFTKGATFYRNDYRKRLWLKHHYLPHKPNGFHQLNFPDLRDHKEISIDLETKDPQLKTHGSGSIVGKGCVTGIAVAVDGWKGYYPIAHEGGGNMDKDVVLKWLKEVLLTNADKIFHNAMYDVCWLRAMGFKINGRIIDTMIATSLIDENRGRYDLNSICKDYIHESKNEYALQDAAKSWGVDPKQEMYKLPAIYVGEYAEKDAELTLKLWQACKQKLKAEEVESIFDLETSLIPCLIDMRFKGVRVDIAEAEKLKKMMGNEREKAS